jgi:hypothetical protein
MAQAQAHFIPSLFLTHLQSGVKKEQTFIQTYSRRCQQIPISSAFWGQEVTPFIPDYAFYRRLLQEINRAKAMSEEFLEGFQKAGQRWAEHLRNCLLKNGLRHCFKNNTCRMLKGRI